MLYCYRTVNVVYHVNMKKAFTLLEILVVIGIISVLVALGAVSYSSAQKKARDAKRKSDIKAIQNAMEQYYSICGFSYPTSLGTSMVCPTGSVNIMPTVPVDPKTITPYPYSTGTPGTICTTLESETPSSYCVYTQQN